MTYYFDNAATTPLTQKVADSMVAAFPIYGNPSSLHQDGRKASKLLRDSRETIAKLLHVQSRHIIFTSGGTESNNTATKGYALANQDKGKHLITTSIEHHSVLHTMSYLEERFGFEVTYLEPIDGTISAQQVANALRDDTILVSTMYANNETGDIFPIADIGQIVKDHQAAFHVDAVQAMGKIPLAPQALNIDFLSASAHKFHGPKGVGFLVANPLHFDALLHGGEQEEKRRASTENLISIAGMSTALAESYAKMDDAYSHVEQLKNDLLDHLNIPYYLNKSENSLPHVLNIGFPKSNNGMLLTRLDLAGFCVSTGSACTAGTVDPSHVLTAYYGENAPQLTESIRISFSDQNTHEEVLALAQTLNQILGG